MANFKPHYSYPGEAVVMGDYATTPFRMLRAGLMAGGVSLALWSARAHFERAHTGHFFSGLTKFMDACVRKWEFQASIADRFTAPGRVFH